MSDMERAQQAIEESDELCAKYYDWSGPGDQEALIKSVAAALSAVRAEESEKWRKAIYNASEMGYIKDAQARFIIDTIDADPSSKG